MLCLFSGMFDPDPGDWPHLWLNVIFLSDLPLETFKDDILTDITVLMDMFSVSVCDDCDDWDDCMFIILTVLSARG